MTDTKHAKNIEVKHFSSDDLQNTYVVLLCAPQNFHTFCRHHSGRFVYLVSKQKGRKKSCYDQGFTIKDIMYVAIE